MPEFGATPKRSFTLGGLEGQLGSTNLNDSRKNLFTHVERAPLANLLDSAYLLNTKKSLLVFRSFAEEHKSPDVTAVQSERLGTMNVAGITLEALRGKCNLSSDYKFVLESGDVMAESTPLGSYIELISENVQSLKALSTANEPKVARLCIYYTRTSNPAATAEIAAVLGHDPEHPCSGNATDTAALRQSTTPGRMCEKQWESVINTAKLTCGFVFDEDKVEWARKPAFKLNRPMLARGDEAPLFNVRDHSGMELVEIDSQQKERSQKFGLDEKSFRFAAEISAFWALAGKLNLGMEKSKAENWVDAKSSITKTLEVTHNYPRVEVFFGTESLQLTEVCKQSLEQLLEAESRDNELGFINLLNKFLKDYGAFFSTKKVLGGKLSFKREVCVNKITNLEEEKKKLKIEAKVSVEKSLHIAGIPVSVGAGPGIGFGPGSGTSEYTSTSFTTDSIAWEAVGGDTTWTRNPGKWTQTVKDYELWRVLQHQETVSILQLISEINPEYDPIHARYLRILQMRKQKAVERESRMLAEMQRQQEERLARRRQAEMERAHYDEQMRILRNSPSILDFCIALFKASYEVSLLLSRGMNEAQRDRG